MAAVDAGEYRRVVGRFATGVTLVTTHIADAHHALTANSFASVSLEPVLVSICVEKVARFHDAVLAGGVWGVSVLGAGQEEVSRLFATRGRPWREEQFDDLAHHNGSETGCVLLDDSLATFEVRTTSTHDAGDHTLLIGEVLALASPRPYAEPLLYFEGRYRVLPRE